MANYNSSYTGAQIDSAVGRTNSTDVTAGTLTASKAVVVGTDSKINEWKVDNIKIDGNTISSTDTNGNIILSPNGTGNVNLNNGNLVFGTSGNGIDFSATANSSGTMTGELLDDYEEGTWTPVPNAGSWTVGNATYTKIGRLVNIAMHCYGFTTSGSATLTISGLPFTSTNDHGTGAAILSGFNRAGVSNYIAINNTTTTIKILCSLDSGGSWDDLLQSQINTGSSIILSYRYIA